MTNDKAEVRVVALEYNCPCCHRCHRKSVAGDFYEPNTRWCSHCGVEMWVKEVKIPIKKAE